MIEITIYDDGSVRATVDSQSADIKDVLPQALPVLNAALADFDVRKITPDMIADLEVVSAQLVGVHGTYADRLKSIAATIRAAAALRGYLHGNT